MLADITIEAPDASGLLTVFPLFGPEPRLEYRSFAEARAFGACVRELPGGASVGDLLVVNPTDLPVLLFEGEEIVGAQQDRTLDISVLVPAGAELVVPVSCVEHGRWDHRRHAEDFQPSPRAAYPELRRHKNEHARAAMAAGRAPRAEQGEVWRAVAAKADRLGTTADTGAMGGIFEDRSDQLERLRSRVTRRPAQIGALVAVGGSFAVLDLVSRSDAFAALHAPLLAGYALDALDAGAVGDGVGAPSVQDAQAWLAALLESAVTPAPSIGTGRAVRLEGARAAGTGLEVDGELVALSVFSR